MNQLKPKTILAVGLSGSLVANFAIAGSAFWLIDSDLPDWKLVASVLAMVTWLILSVPIFVGMALIRKRIGRFNGRLQEIMAALRCACTCLLVGALGFGGAYAFREQMVYQMPIYGGILFLVGMIGAALLTFTCINIFVRFFTRSEFAG